MIDGADAVFLGCANVPEQVDFECTVVDQAARPGVGRIVKLSAQGADPAAAVAYWRWHAQIEEHLRASGVPSVVLQPSFYMSNLFAATEHVREQGMLFAPAGDAAITMVHPADVAAVAAVALTTDGHDGATYLVTGPEAITYTQVATDLSTRSAARWVTPPSRRRRLARPCSRAACPTSWSPSCWRSSPPSAGVNRRSPATRCSG